MEARQRRDGCDVCVCVCAIVRGRYLGGTSSMYFAKLPTSTRSKKWGSFMSTTLPLTSVVFMGRMLGWRLMSSSWMKVVPVEGAAMAGAGA